MLRNLWFFFWFLPASVLCSTAMIVSGRLGALRFCRRLSRMWGQLALRLSNSRLEADLSAAPAGGEFVIMANHQSLFDIPILFSLFPDRLICFVAKESLFRIPLFGGAMRISGNISIDRENQRKAMRSIDLAAERARAGFTVVIFPEGTRNPDPEALAEFKIGGMIMAIKCGVPVLPVVIAGSRDILPAGALRLRPGPHLVRLKALPPVVTQGRYTLKERERFRADMYALMNAAYVELTHARHG